MERAAARRWMPLAMPLMVVGTVGQRKAWDSAVR